MFCFFPSLNTLQPNPFILQSHHGRAVLQAFLCSQQPGTDSVAFLYWNTVWLNFGFFFPAMLPCFAGQSQVISSEKKKKQTENSTPDVLLELGKSRVKTKCTCKWYFSSNLNCFVFLSGMQSAEAVCCGRGV